jgi:hydroxymethylglutaryl-CoA synthase
VDGPLSVTSYVNAVDKAYESYRTKYEKKFGAKTNGVNGHANGVNGAATNGHSQSHGITAASFDYVLFHSWATSLLRAACLSSTNRVVLATSPRPYGKQVQKGHARMVSSDLLVLRPSSRARSHPLFLFAFFQLYNDFRNYPEDPMFAEVPKEFATMDMKASLSDKNVEKAMIAASKVSSS